MATLTLHPQVINDQYYLVYLYRGAVPDLKKLCPLCDSEDIPIQFTLRGCFILAHLLGAKVSDRYIEQLFFSSDKISAFHGPV